MLHEILLSLSGHRSPLLRPDHAPAGSIHTLSTTLSPPERALLTDLSRLSDLHIRLRAQSARIVAQHPSVVCRAVGAAIESVHLAAFQQAVLSTEATVLRRDPALVGAYDIVPLTAVAAAFADWPRRLNWLWELAQFVLPAAEPSSEHPLPSGAKLIDHLCGELQTGYEDIEAAARSLVHVAEMAWLKQVSAWILYGRLPSFGGDDFFVQQQTAAAEAPFTAGEYVCIARLLPSFVTASTAASMLSIGRSLVHMRGAAAAGQHRLDSRAAAADAEMSSFQDFHLSSQLQELSRLTYPLDGTTFSRAVVRIRAVLSRTALQRLLPPAKVVEMLQLLRDFFLLGRGEFAMALVEQADAAMRSRWQQVGHLVSNATTASGLRGMNAVMVKDGEVAAVLSRTWATLGAMQAGGRHANVDDEEDEDEGLELARETLRLSIYRPSSSDGRASTPQQHMPAIVSTPFRNLLLSVPVTLTLQVPYPLDLVLSPADLQAYAAIHAYLLSIRRAHIRLTGLWKLSSLRRHHPPPPGPPYGGPSTSNSLAHVRMLRDRYTTRANALRSMWATSSAAVFFLSVMEGYLQAEVVVELWDGFQQWLAVGKDAPRGEDSGRDHGQEDGPGSDEDDKDGDVWMAEAAGASKQKDATATSHDPQTLATAHRRYLRRLLRGLLLDHHAWTDALYVLLVAMDQLVALVQRLHALWAALDLEADAGVVDAFVDLDREQNDVMDALSAAEVDVRQGVGSAVEVLRDLNGEDDDDTEEEEDDDDDEPLDTSLGADRSGLGLRAVGTYVPRRIGGLDRLLMKMDFGSWAADKHPQAAGHYGS
ncbi:gamma-tubulin complex component [Grosmannia clavigera kw1407]|uniref:Spindle pole body component n=1 Tax=Grosmannia clavigera (strain kw1407 / UAMH 11150) TaxID=655863 RepID=F0X969_GROCL|nr:gamma-tubulin complex component [Grosmannia clavigera kw1407]EFX05415.1 gamma-tubulin complex component [Grosmannia clavigera kw1407]